MVLMIFLLLSQLLVLFVLLAIKVMILVLLELLLLLYWLAFIYNIASKSMHHCRHPFRQVKSVPLSGTCAGRFSARGRGALPPERRW